MAAPEANAAVGVEEGEEKLMDAKREPPCYRNLIKNLGMLQTMFKKSDDLAVALKAVTYLEHLLEVVLRETFFIKGEHKTLKGLFDRGFLGQGNIHNKASLLYCLGGLTETQFKYINVIIAIRNKFAHRYGEVRFELEDIKETCEKLDPVNDLVWPAIEPSITKQIESYGMTKEDIYNEYLQDFRSPRSRFIMAVSFLVSTIILKVSAGQDTLKLWLEIEKKDWPKARLPKRLVDQG